MLRYFFILLVFSPLMMVAQPAGFVNVKETGITGYELISSNYYDGKSLWGYMNGGADLYLEYGFEGLLVQEITINGISVKCEIYKMRDALGAYGIFSVNRHKCQMAEGFKPIHCLNNYQVQVVKGDYYFSLINQAGDATAQKATLEVAQQLEKLVTDKEIPFPVHGYFAGKSNRLVYLEGEISLSNVYPQALAYLDDVAGYSMWILPAEEKNAPVVSILQFNSAGVLKEYAGNAFPGISFETQARRKLKNGGELMAKRLTETTVLQVEGKTSKTTKKLLGFD